MASSKRPNYIVETKLATERKRRRSDLVIMWQSMWSVTSVIFQELWMALLRMWEYVQMWFSSSERFEVQTWLEKYLPYVPDDFSDSWRDGRLLAILLNKLQPGCFPDACQLDPDYGLRNVYKAFDVLEMYFGINPNVSAEEIVICVDGSELKLFGILLELKLLTDNQIENQDPPEPEPKENTEESIISQSCIAKGTGLAVGFVGRLTNFIIFCAFIPDLDVIIEIRGPNTICSERITKRSPKKKRSVASWEYTKSLTRSISLNEEKNSLTTEEDENLDKRIISLEYEIMGNQISVGYRPKEKGQHKLSILWHGQHVSDSPYFVTIEDPSQITGTNLVIHRKSALKTANEREKNESRKNSVRFQESHVRYKDQTKPAGRVLSRRVLRYIVKINGKDIPVNAESTDSLATELLKMEYDFETCPSSHRRNSWGFTGDAERKKSVIRQFGIDVKELEAQICLKRSRSLSINPGSKRLLEKSDSLDSLTPRLHIVNEDVFESCDKIHENEGDYAYINEDIALEENEIKSNEVLEMHVNTCMERATETFKLPNKLLRSNSVENSDVRPYDEIEFDAISSLSTETTHVDRVDNSNEDLPSNISPIPESDESGIETTVKLAFNCEVSNRELNNNDRERRGNEKTGYETTMYLKTSFSKKMKKQYSKNKKYRKDKKCVQAKNTQKSEKQISYSESPRNVNSVSVLPITIFRNKRRIKKPILKTKDCISLKVLECLKHMDTVKLKYLRKQNDIDQYPIEAQCSYNEISDIPNNFSITDKPSCQNNSLSVEECCTTNNEETKISYANKTFRNIVHLEESKDNGRTSRHEIQEPEIKKVIINHNLNAVQPSTQSQIKVQGVNDEEPKTLRTHTLRTIEQLNFKQFNPSVDSQSCASPVKSQIVQWESTLSTENQKSTLKRTNTSETDQVSVKEKLAFWENTYKIEQNSLTQSTLENNRKINLLDNSKSCKSVEGNTNTMRNDLRNLPGTGTDLPKNNS